MSTTLPLPPNATTDGGGMMTSNWTGMMPSNWTGMMTSNWTGVMTSNWTGIMTSNWTGAREGVSTTAGDCLVLRHAGGVTPWDDPENVVSYSVERVVDSAVSVVCLPIFFLISAPTNILSMLVFWKQGLKERINLCLFYLSLVDFVHMMGAFFINVDRLFLPLLQTGRFGPVFRFIVGHGLLGFRNFNWLSGFVSMLVACERCFCVVSPLHSRTILSARTTGVILATSTLLVLPGAFLVAMRWTVACVFEPQSNATSDALVTGKFFVRNISHMKVITLLYASVLQVICFSVISMTTIVTSVKLRAMVVWREQTSSTTLSSREIILTRMLIATSVLYIVCAFPSTMAGIGAIILDPGTPFMGKHYNTFKLFVNLFELTSYVNATLNFFVYCSLGSKYRTTLRTLVRCLPSKTNITKQSSTATKSDGRCSR